MQANVKNDTAAAAKRRRSAPKKSKHPRLKIVLIALLIISTRSVWICIFCNLEGT